jgi:capsular exopolysaccharide synthesis family protein
MASSPLVLSKPASDRDLATVTSTPQVDPGVIIRGLKRYGLWILVISVAISAPLMLLIYTTMGPTYEAISRIRIEPAQSNLYDPGHTGITADIRSYEPYLQTQVNLMTSNQVLGRAIQNPLVANQPMIRRSEDAKTVLREKMIVEIEPNTYLIQLRLESKDPAEAAAIVNAVVDSYVDENNRYTQSKDANLKANLMAQLTDLGAEIDKKNAELKELNKKGAMKIYKPPLNPHALKEEDEGITPTVNVQDQQQINAMIAQMVQIDIDLLTAQANLRARLELQNSHQDGGLQIRQDDHELENRVKEVFYDDPEVNALSKEIRRVEDELNRQKQVVRKSSDPARVAAQKELAKLDKEWKELWAVKSDEIRKRLQMGTGDQSPRDAISALENTIKVLKEKKTAYAELYKKQEVEQKATSDESFKFAYAQHELNGLLGRQEQVKRNLAQVEFQSRQEQYRVVLVDKAETPKIPSNNKRWKYIAAAPLAVLFLMLGFFLLIEIKAERVANLEALSTRVPCEVYALPPLPKSRQLRKRNQSALENHNEIEQFIQRLDHLRFGVCGNSIQTGKGRCVLITSAIGAEGKTTLAAQLAARCGTAGMSTLLVDADFRRSKLCSLLDVPEGPGLSDVLKGHSAIEAVVVPVQGGTFNLLCAGTPIRDTSTLLEDSRIGMFIAQLRQLYDLVIIDSPPVLPVPDALILGRWTDGAVLASRTEISRFSQVERARRQLDSAGIPVLGTVLNGLRRSDSYYGRYAYSRRPSSETDSSNTS